MHRPHPFICFLIPWLLLTGCAQIVSPGGGPADTTPPRALRYQPDSGATNFSAREITIDFDEYIQLRDLSNQLVISPPLAVPPEITVRGRSLVVRFAGNTELRPNTTYSILFGTALQDLNEGNAKEGFRYIFSTGASLDTTTVRGKVKNALDHSAEKGMSVLLATAGDDSALYRGKPMYFARTGADGKFVIPHVKPGKYDVYAIRDANSNLRYERGEEQVAFFPAAITAGDSTTLELLSFSEAPPRTILRKRFHDQHGKVTLELNHYPDSLRIQALNAGKGAQEYIEHREGSDTVIYWIRNHTADSLVLKVDDGTVNIDTLSFRFISLDEAKRSKKNPLRLVISSNASPAHDLDKALVLTSSTPILAMDTTRMIFGDKEAPSKMRITQEGLRQFRVRPEARAGKDSTQLWKEEQSIPVTLLPGAFTDAFGQTNDTVRLSLRTRPEKYYGSLTLVANSMLSGRLIQLIDERGKVIRQAKAGAAPILFSWLPPQRYRLKAITDVNGNNRWDAGKVATKQLPEPVMYHPEQIMIRSNWDAEIEWQAR